MGLGISTGGDEEFLPLLSYNAKAGRLKLEQRVETAAGWQKQEKDVTSDKPVFVMDMVNIHVGWMLFRKGVAPVKALVKIGQPFPPCPTGDFGVDDKGKAIKPKQGFLMHVMDAQGVVREFASTANACTGAVDELHTAYTAAPEAAAGKLPVVQFTDAVEVKSKHGSNYAPVFAIVRWADRPAALVGPSAPTVTIGRPAAPTPAHTPQPATAPAAPVLDDAIPFAPEFR